MRFHEKKYSSMDASSQGYGMLGYMGTDLTFAQANQLGGFARFASTGQGVAEVVTPKRDVLESIPKQHFEEIGRVGKLTGVKPSIHAPWDIETSGFTKNGWSEQQRKSEEGLVKDVIDKAHLMDKERNIPVTFHADVLGAGTIWRKEGLRDVQGKLVKDQPEMIHAVDQISGQVVPIRYEEKEYPDGKTKIWTTQLRLDNLNQTQWMSEVEKLHAESFRMGEIQKEMQRIHMRQNQGEISQEQANQMMSGLRGYSETAASSANSQVLELYNNMKKNSPVFEINSPDARVRDRAIRNKEWFEENSKKVVEEKRRMDEEKEKLYTKYKQIDDSGRKDVKAQAERRFITRELTELSQKELINWQAFFGGTVDHGVAPQKFVPIEDFSIKHSSDTYANAALHSYLSYEKKGMKAPIISIENPPAMQFGISRADALAKLVEQSREKFVQQGIKKGLSQGEAQRAAKKMIGVTWDTGHIYQLKQGGYTHEDILKETEKIAPYVKHFHITDNFGHADTHLPPGFGEIPIKEIAQKLKEKGVPVDKMRKIIEAGGFVSAFKRSPFPQTMEYFNSPVYTLSATPEWEQARNNYFFGSAQYNAGYGTMLPQQHFAMYGSGFSGLPASMGGQVGGEKSRFSGTPNS